MEFPPKLLKQLNDIYILDEIGMKVLIIVVTYNATRWLDKCVNSIMHSSVKVDSIFIDNGSKDNTVQDLRDKYNCNVVEAKQNLGFGRANNIGISYAITHGYDFVYLLNQDAWLHENTIADLIESHNTYPQYGIISPMQFKRNETDLDANFVGNVIKTNNQLINDSFCNKLSDIYEVQSVMAAHWLISRDCFTTVGLFSPTFPHYGEDDNYIQRAKYHGFKVGISTRVKAVHDRGERTTSKQKEMYWCSYIQHLTSISNINNGTIMPYIKMLIMNVRYSLLYRSFTPLYYSFLILYRSFIVIKNKKASKQVSAFYK